MSDKPEKKNDEKPPEQEAGEKRVDEGWKEEARRDKERLAAEKAPQAAPAARLATEIGCDTYSPRFGTSETQLSYASRFSCMR